MDALMETIVVAWWYSWGVFTTMVVGLLTASLAIDCWRRAE